MIKSKAAMAVNYKLLKITSSAFIESDLIPIKYTCDGINVNPPLHIEQIPEETKSLAVIMDDPDASSGTWVHWLVWDIPVTHQIKEGKINGIQGLNDFQQQKYGGPCPPSGTHCFHFKIYALDILLNLPEKTYKLLLERAMSGHVIAFGELTGLYKINKLF